MKGFQYKIDTDFKLNVSQDRKRIFYPGLLGQKGDKKSKKF